MPLANEDVEQAGYRTLLEKSVMPTLKGWQVQRTPSPQGKLAVLYDKNKLEVSGYAATLADLAGERVYLVSCYADDLDPKALIGNKGWCSMSQSGRLYHVGTIPNLKGNIWGS